MQVRLGMAGLGLLAALACSGGPTQPDATVAAVAGPYRLAKVDGEVMPCCKQVRGANLTETWASGGLELRLDSTYVFEVIFSFDSTAGDSTVTWIQGSPWIVAGGTYVPQGKGLVLSDSLRGATNPLYGSIRGDTVTLRRGADTFELVRSFAPGAPSP